MAKRQSKAAKLTQQTMQPLSDTVANEQQPRHTDAGVGCGYALWHRQQLPRKASITAEALRNTMHAERAPLLQVRRACMMVRW